MFVRCSHDSAPSRNISATLSASVTRQSNTAKNVVASVGWTQVEYAHN